MGRFSNIILRIKSWQKFGWVNVILKPYRVGEFLITFFRMLINGEVNDQIRECIPKSELKSVKKSINTDFVMSNIKYGASLSDYFDYEFYNKSHEERDEFITEGRVRQIFLSLNPIEYNELFKDKYKTYQYLKKFYGRDVLYPAGGIPLEDFITFCRKRDRLFLKPNSLQFGFGAELIVIDKSLSLESLYDRCMKSNLIVEDVIVQHSELAAFHPSSLNTIRINTIVTKNSVRVMTAALKMGNSGSIVDNFSGGGISALICVQSGIIYTPGVDKKHNWYSKHPYSNQQIEGYRLPYWKEVIEFAEEIALVIPKTRYVGWDISICENGKIMLVEGNNYARFKVQQIPDQMGKRRIYQEALKDI